MCVCVNAPEPVLSYYWHVKPNCRHGRELQCHTCQSFGHKSKFCQYQGHGNDETAGKVNSLHSLACTHVTPRGNHFTVLNSINDDATVFNLKQVNTSLIIYAVTTIMSNVIRMI